MNNSFWLFRFFCGIFMGRGSGCLHITFGGDPIWRDGCLRLPRGAGGTQCYDTVQVGAWSRRDPKDPSKGHSDPEARVCRGKKGRYFLGYKSTTAATRTVNCPQPTWQGRPTRMRNDTSGRTPPRLGRGFRTLGGMWRTASTAARG